jgi:hypothetical protein
MVGASLAIVSLVFAPLSVAVLMMVGRRARTMHAKARAEMPV